MDQSVPLGNRDYPMGPHGREVIPHHRRALRILKGTALFEDRFISDHEDLKAVLAILHNMGCVIAFTTGVWDLFHIGHGDYIQRGKDEAAKLCPEAEHVILVVGVDTDELTRERKGPTRPIVPEDERYRVLGHLRPVDIIVPQYKEGTLYKLVRPDVRIISQSTGDLPNEEEMRKYCTHLVNLPPQSETSTTARVRRLAMDGASDLAGVVSQAVSKYLRGNGTE